MAAQRLVRSSMRLKRGTLIRSESQSEKGSGSVRVFRDALAMELWEARWTGCSWRTFLATREIESELTAIRQCTHTGRPLDLTPIGKICKS
jgi:hypothetical protein